MIFKKKMKRRNTKKKLIKKKLRKPYPDASLFDYKNLDFIKEFLTEKGKIVPRKLSGLEAKDQRRLAKVVKRARHAGLISFTNRF